MRLSYPICKWLTPTLLLLGLEKMRPLLHIFIVLLSLNLNQCMFLRGTDYRGWLIPILTLVFGIFWYLSKRERDSKAVKKLDEAIDSSTPLADGPLSMIASVFALSSSKYGLIYIVLLVIAALA